MDRATAGQYFIWLILLIVFVGLPALLRRSRMRALGHNQQGACGRCGRSLEAGPQAYMEGFRVCAACDKTLRRRSMIGLGFISLFAATAVVASLAGLAEDARRGTPDPWWAYLIVLGMALAFGGLIFFALSRSRAANRRAAERDAAGVSRYDVGGEYQP